jgi:inner membrane protein
MDAFDKINGIFSSLGFKLALIAFLSLILLIPSSMIRSLILEREQRRSETVTEVTAIWGDSQTLSGPVLSIPFETSEKEGNGDFKTVTNYSHFLPENIIVNGSIVPEVRNRGIYKVVTYTARLHITGKFVPVVTDGEILNLAPGDSQKAYVEIGIPDMRGINKDILVKWNNETLQVVPGLKTSDISRSGVHVPVDLIPGQEFRFEYDLDLNGSHSLNFIPLGKETNVKLTSTWNAPSFSGAFLPDDRKIDANGFTASWNILQLNRNFPQQWVNDEYSVSGSAFGVELITPVDNYRKSERSVKYAILFIGLTFLVFFFAEVMTKTRIHPVHYLLSGFAIVIFYSLLTALSEHISFNLAYLISSLTIITMVGAFSKSLYSNWKVVLTVITCLTALYIFLFVILQLTDYSLLLGNIGLVIILGIVMYFSRKIDWYSARNQGNS